MRRLIACTLLVLLAGCSTGQGGGATSPAAGPSTTSTPSPGAAVQDRYDVGGYELSITCQGTGGPTVVYFHGLGGAGSDVNEALAPRLAGQVRLMLDAALPSDDELDRLIPADLRAQVMAEQEANPERLDLYRTLDQAKALVGSIPDVPVTYVAAEPVELPSEWPVERMRKLIRAKQSAFVDRFPHGRLVPVTSSHNVDLDQPELVITELDRILSR